MAQQRDSFTDIARDLLGMPSTHFDEVLPVYNPTIGLREDELERAIRSLTGETEEEGRRPITNSLYAEEDFPITDIEEGVHDDEFDATSFLEETDLGY